MTPAVEPIQIPTWQYPWLRHAFSTRAGGTSTVYGTPSLNLGFTKEDSADAVHENRRLLVEATAPDFSLIVPKQIHSAIIRTITAPDDPPGEADALITNVPNILIGIGTADCVPILIADTRNHAVAAIHAGWRGTVACIVEHTIAQMRSTSNSDPADLIAAIGPSIGACCYTVGEEVHSQFVAAFSYADTLFTPSLNLDLWEANHRQLLDSGFTPSQITTVAQCTACSRNSDGSRRFFSHRDEHGQTGRMLNVIGVVS